VPLEYYVHAHGNPAKAHKLRTGYMMMVLIYFHTSILISQGDRARILIILVTEGDSQWEKQAYYRPAKD